MNKEKAQKLLKLLNVKPQLEYSEIARHLNLHVQTVANGGRLLSCLGLAPMRKRGGANRPMRHTPTPEQARLLNRAYKLRRQGLTWILAAESMGMTRMQLYNLHRRFGHKFDKL